MPDELAAYPLTMVRPKFNNRTHPDARWSSEEIAAWVASTKAQPGAVPWRLQWIEDAEATLAARSTAGTD